MFAHPDWGEPIYFFAPLPGWLRLSGARALDRPVGLKPAQAKTQA